MAILTMKFGGGSLGTAEALSKVLAIIIAESKNWERVIIVVSALEGVTDMLLEAATQARVGDQRGYRRIAATLRARHLAIADQLPFDVPDRVALKAEIDQLLSDLLDQCQKIANTLHDELLPGMNDAMVAVGERLSARIIAALLRQNHLLGITVDGTELIVTDAVHGNAAPNMSRTADKIKNLLQPMLEREIVPVVTGYIGATEAGATTTLGRGGTDITASVLSALLQADELWIWTDVDGIMTADPRLIPAARVIPRLDYGEAAELAYFGAKILHAKMIAPLSARAIPLRIKNIFRPAQTGTEIRYSPQARQPKIKAVTSIQGLALTRSASGSMAGITRLVGKTLFQTLGMRTEVMIASQSSNKSFLCLVIPTSIGIDGVERLQQALRDKMAEYPEKMPWRIETVALVSAIGADITAEPALLAQVLGKLNEIPLVGLAIGPSRSSVTMAVAQDRSSAALASIHELIVKSG